MAAVLAYSANTNAQADVDARRFKQAHHHSATVNGNTLAVQWPVNKKQHAELCINLKEDEPLFRRLEIISGSKITTIIKDADPVFLLTVGKRDLVSQNGWNIFFDKVSLKPHRTYLVQLQKQHISVLSCGSRTIIQIDRIKAADFSGSMEITLYNGSALFNIAAVMATAVDSTAIVYDAGLVSQKQIWTHITWTDVYNKIQTVPCMLTDTSVNLR